MALVLVTGILDNGTPRSATLVQNARTPLDVVATETTTIRLTVFYNNGVPVVLTDPEEGAPTTATLSIKRSSYDYGPPRIKLVGVKQPSLGPNVVDFELAAARTRLVPPGRYVYDVWLSSALDGRNAVVPLSTLWLGPTVLNPY